MNLDSRIEEGRGTKLKFKRRMSSPNLLNDGLRCVPVTYPSTKTISESLQ